MYTHVFRAYIKQTGKECVSFFSNAEGCFGNLMCSRLQVLMYTSEVAWQPSEMSNSLQFDKKGTLGGKKLIQGHIEVRFESRFLCSRILFSAACHHKTMKSLHMHTRHCQNYFVLVCARNAELTCQPLSILFCLCPITVLVFDRTEISTTLHFQRNS